MAIKVTDSENSGAFKMLYNIIIVTLTSI